MLTRADDGAWVLADESATLALGRRLAAALTTGAPAYIALEGELGAGKTTLVRGMLRGLGYTSTVVSPTYTLMEEYQTRGGSVVHVDLFRISDPEELEFLGLRERFADSVVLVEWPRKGAAWLPPADLQIHLELLGNGRRAAMRPLSAEGERILARVEALADA